MTFGRRSTRINDLLRDRDHLQRDLEEATHPEHAADIRASLNEVNHSLWLAGHEPEEVA